MLPRLIVGDTEGGAHYRSRKHDNMDIGRGRVQISALVSNKPILVLEKGIYLFCILSYLLLLSFKARALMLRHLIKTSCIRIKVGGAIIQLAHFIVVNIRKWALSTYTF